ncbi:hypothetical protein ABB28_00595 [Stenotrophomonas chelatiphaga]|uniref:Transmembrane protein n=1 Tax=Stenotrophomonas chelatiphaga TaxID=517011 RepID=A0A0R0DHC1_9GAMM|nr:hypothetical protein [Stenotrophomonas chelatiphaga]KRG77687.1 hypothetical protein ABB28_00595 [Stenotrophomonas chelatiphaga]ROQ36921.1 hypothetical protein EDF77_3562 [Stenotrophomonas maltophilia]
MLGIQAWGAVESGVLGGTLASMLVAWWTRRLPRHYKGWSRGALSRRHRTEIRIANTLFFAGLLSGVALYPLGGFAPNDPRPLLLAFGLASLLPLLALMVVPWLSGRSVRAAFVAFSHGQGTPVWATYPLLAAGLVGLGFAVAGFLR